MLPLNVWATQKEHLSKMIVILSASFLKTLLENVAFDFYFTTYSYHMARLYLDLN